MYQSNSAFTENSEYDVVVPITMEDLQQAVLGDGMITRNYILTWNFVENESGKPGENSVSIKQNITIKLNAATIQIKDTTDDAETDGKTIWDENIAKIYKLENPAPATPAEENKTTEENKKDDVPKTGEVIYI